MQGDFDRVTFDGGARSFANVLLQQGRLLLPADFNEQSAIHHYFLRNLITDLVGRRWRADTGFTIEVKGAAKLKPSIVKGRYYVDGIACENHETCPFEEQPFGPVAEDPTDFAGPKAAIYLDCWERHVTWLNEPAIRESALGGPDTATRAQIAWQGRLLSPEIASDALDPVKTALETRKKSETIADAKKKVQEVLDAVTKALKDFVAGIDDLTTAAALDAFDKARPRLAADAKDEADQSDPCAIAADAEYRGRENQLYRVEVHHAGLPGTATFKWSRENGSVAFKVLDIDIDAGAKTTRVTLESLGRDRRTGLCPNDWVELTDDGSELTWSALPLLQVDKIDGHRRVVTLRGAAPSTLRPGAHAILRRWDHRADATANGAMFLKESQDDTGWIDLERGVKIRFAPGGLYQKGDYWLIPTRVATGDVEWPNKAGVPMAIEPHGITHHRAALAIVSKGVVNWNVDSQCGCRRDPLCP
jgi:hypothetical protein